MYSGCHEQYQKGIVALYNALKTEESFKGLVMRLKMQPSSSTALATALAEFLEAQPKK